MKRIFTILTLACIYLVLCSKNCNDGAEQDAAKDQQAIQAAKDSLSSMALHSSSPDMALSGEEARYLFADVVDYLKIVADFTLEPIFREQAKKMILESFLSESGVVTVTELPLVKLIREPGFKLAGLLITRPDSIWVAKPLRPLNDTLFKGSLGYSTTLQGKTRTAGNQPIVPGDGTIDFYAIKADKIFGLDTVKVWSVRLGENRRN